MPARIRVESFKRILQPLVSGTASGSHGIQPGSVLWQSPRLVHPICGGLYFQVVITHGTHVEIPCDPHQQSVGIGVISARRDKFEKFGLKEG